MDIGRNINAALKNKGITQKSLAESVGVSQAQISMYINGYNTPTLDTIERIANVLGCNIMELIGISGHTQENRLKCPKCGCKIDVTITIK